MNGIRCFQATLYFYDVLNYVSSEYVSVKRCKSSLLINLLWNVSLREITINFRSCYVYFQMIAHDVPNNPCNFWKYVNKQCKNFVLSECKNEWLIAPNA